MTMKASAPRTRPKNNLREYKKPRNNKATNAGIQPENQVAPTSAPKKSQHPAMPNKKARCHRFSVGLKNACPTESATTHNEYDAPVFNLKSAKPIRVLVRRCSSSGMATMSMMAKRILNHLASRNTFAAINITAGSSTISVTAPTCTNVKPKPDLPEPPCPNKSGRRINQL